MEQLAAANIESERIQAQLDTSLDTATCERNQLDAIRKQSNVQIQQLEAAKVAIETEFRTAQSTIESEMALKGFKTHFYDIRKL